MSTGFEIRCYDYVNHPYEEVRDALTKDAAAVFQAATKAAATRAETVASELRLDIAGLRLETDVRIVIKGVEEKPSEALQTPATHVHLEWEAVANPGLFPLMKADLSLYRLTATETQLDFKGDYQPPFGALGKAVNAMIGHRIAQACIHRFVNDVAAHLRQTLAQTAQS